MPASPCQMRLCEFLRRIYAPARLGISSATIAQHGYACRSLAKFLGRRAKISELSEDLLLPWLSARLQEVAPKTVHRERASILAIWRMAAKRGCCDPPPDDVPRVRVPRKLPIGWFPDEYERLVATARQMKGEIRGTGIHKSLWWSSLLIFLYCVGCRIKAALAVTPGDVDLARRYVRLRVDPAKTDLEQILPLSDQAVAAIAAIYCPHREHIWPWPYGREYIWHVLGKLLETAGLPNDRYHKFQCCRRTNGSLVAVNGSIDAAARQLGHTSTAMTTKHYLDPRILNAGQQPLVPPLRLGNGERQLRLF